MLFHQAQRHKQLAMRSARNAMFYYRKSGHPAWRASARAAVANARMCSRIMVERLREWRRGGSPA
jgi:hypothetical protein